MAYSHGPDSSEDRRIILKEYKLYVSDNRFHDLHYVQHLLQTFYNHLKERDIQVDQHWICSYYCVGWFKNVVVFQWLSLLHKKCNALHIYNYF